MPISGGGSLGSVTLYTDVARTQVATAQQVIDAFSAGGVRISATSGDNEIVMTVLTIAHPTIATATQTADDESSPAAVLLTADPITLKLIGFKLME